ncbi:MAG: alanine racemase, partial [Bacteroidota bacterium]
MSQRERADYFEQLNRSLKEYHRAIPFLLIDLDRVDGNAALFKANLPPKVPPRLVVKSLPAPQLLQYLANRLDTHRYMVFHQPFLSALTTILDDQADVLLGKPMPLKTAAYFYRNLPHPTTTFNPFTQVQWLIDTVERARQYLQLAEELQQPLRLNLEIDVGLHRGGFQNLEALSEVLALIAAQRDKLIFSGFMGYDPHVVKIPKLLRSPERSLQLSNRFYEECKKMVREQFPQLWNDQLTFNGAGSPTVSLH